MTCSDVEPEDDPAAPARQTLRPGARVVFTPREFLVARVRELCGGALEVILVPRPRDEAGTPPAAADAGGPSATP